MTSKRQSENVYSKMIYNNSKVLETPKLFTNRRIDKLWYMHDSRKQQQRIVYFLLHDISVDETHIVLRVEKHFTEACKRYSSKLA